VRANRSPFASTDTGHFKAVVTKPQNVLIMRDIACAGYVAGCNTRWFAKDEDGEFTSGQAAQAIQDRLSFADDNTDRYASMLAFPCYEGQFESGQLDTVMSVTSRLLPWEVNNAGVHNSFPGGPEAYLAYSGALQLGQVHYGEDMKAAENQDFISQGSTNNATCFLGPSRRYDPFTRSFMSLVPGQGHFGPDAIPGDARWRRGESVSLKTARDSMCRSPQAQTPATRPHPQPTNHQPPTTNHQPPTTNADNRSFQNLAGSRSNWPSTRRWPTRRVKQRARARHRHLVSSNHPSSSPPPRRPALSRSSLPAVDREKHSRNVFPRVWPCVCVRVLLAFRCVWCGA